MLSEPKNPDYTEISHYLLLASIKHCDETMPTSLLVLPLLFEVTFYDVKPDVHIELEIGPLYFAQTSPTLQIMHTTKSNRSCCLHRSVVTTHGQMLRTFAFLGFAL